MDLMRLKTSLGMVAEPPLSLSPPSPPPPPGGNPDDDDSADPAATSLARRVVVLALDDEGLVAAGPVVREAEAVGDHDDTDEDADDEDDVKVRRVGARAKQWLLERSNKHSATGLVNMTMNKLLLMLLLLGDDAMGLDVV